MNAPERLLGLLSSTYRADAVICTYPIYPYFMQRWNAANGKKPLIFTVVTDSIEVNSAWLRAPTDYWLVTDTRTREIMLAQGAPAERVVVTGFPVHPDFAESTPIAADDCCDPFRILYFPTAKLPFIRRHSRALLEASPHVHLTIILGRNVRALYSRAKEIQQQYPGRVKLIGWTSRVPAYLNRHHLVVGKAGGATVHEAIAARCPMLIHHLVPGQEEGNLRLLEDLGAGFLAATPTALGEAVDAMLANQAHSWKAMKASLTEHAMHDGATRAAEFILTTLRR